jgi:hypothetical protein
VAQPGSHNGPKDASSLSRLGQWKTAVAPLSFVGLPRKE